MGMIGCGGRDHIARSGRWKEAGWTGMGGGEREHITMSGRWREAGGQEWVNETGGRKVRGEGRHCKEPDGGRRVEWDRVRVDREGMKWKEAERE